MTAGLSWKIIDSFDDCADALWRKCPAYYTMMAVRSSEVINALYPPADPRFLRVAVYEDGVMVGWIVLLDTEMKQHRQFGDLRVGSIVDGLALPEHARVVVAVAARLLEHRGVNLVVSNQAHVAWTRAMRSAGLLRGPSNFVFACSPALNELLEPFEASKMHLHLTRGDGDGPIHL